MAKMWGLCKHNCHKGKLIDTGDLEFDLFDGQRTFGRFLYGSDDGGDA